MDYSLYLWHNLNNDPVLQKMHETLVAQPGGKEYTAMAALLLPFATTEACTKFVIREYVIRSILADENAFTKQCRGLSGDAFQQMAQYDISMLMDILFSEEWVDISDSNEAIAIEPFDFEPRGKEAVWGFNDSIRKLVETREEKALFEGIVEHLATYGCGRKAEFYAYKFRDGELCGIRDIDCGNFDELLGIDHQKEILLNNTEAFLQGKPANNILLCGSMGSGKSSCVKALLPYFKEQRLRLIELDKRDVGQIEGLIEQLDERSKYIIFLDDLSFQGDDEQYSTLKIALDGQLSKQNKKLLFYATSNRRNLVRDNWIDRKSGGDLHENDTLNEQYSLSERFGIKLYFPNYDQNEYLDIVALQLSALGIVMDEEIRKEALIWASQYHGRSGRTAFNFAKDYCARYLNEVTYLRRN